MSVMTGSTTELSAQKKRELLAELLRRQIAAPKSFPTSFAQQRLWFLSQLEPDNPFYNALHALRLRGTLDITSLERSLTEIVRRHETLRTTFTLVDDKPMQVISPPQPVTMPLRDLSDRPHAEREAEALRRAHHESTLPFDLATGPLLRASLLKLGTEEHVLLLTMHHIASDGGSTGLFFKELSTLYDAYSAGLESPLAELPIQYADYAVWQREWLQGERLEQQLAYWRQQLAQAATLELPLDHPRPPVQSYKGARHSTTLSPEVSEGIKALSQRSGVTLFMTLLAAFQLLLSRYSRQTDIVVGTPIAGRTRSETESLIGFFVNTLVLRTDCGGDPTFSELLGRVREVCLGAYGHQDVPFEKLVEELEPERDLSHNPLFQVMFALQNATKEPAQLSGLQMSPMQVGREAIQFDLMLSMVDNGTQLKAILEYGGDLFEAETITRVLKHFEQLLGSIVADPERRVSGLALLSEAERQQLLVAWNDTRRDYPTRTCIHELFEQQAALAPDALALVFADTQLTYGELNGRANQLAHHLRARGVGPDVLVGVLLERSVEMVVGLLGILKAGGAYLPLDSAYPVERLSFMLADAEAKVVLTQERWLRQPELSSLWGEAQGEVMCLEREAAEVGQRPESNLSSVATPEQLAYVIYTSGSTGIPKGVGIPHRGVLRLVCNSDYVQLTPHDRVAQGSNASFDAATFEIWGALLSGARLVGISKEVALSPAEYAVQLQRQGVTTVFVTTALFNQLAQAAPGCFSRMRQVLFGGEAVEPRRVREVQAAGGPERLLHVYGPTESTTFATWQRVGEVEEGARTIGIGRAIGNTQVYVLDGWMELAPVGVAGELYIGGDGLARGYLNRPGLTAEKFVPNAFSSEAGARLYRTGDLVKYLPDGNLEFLGRIDHQVKIRGYRIELGEIEAVLSGHAGVGDCVVIAREDEPGDKRLVAYLVADTQGVVTSNELRSYLKERLPEYMVPSAFVLLDEMPLTPNGKVDRRALPAPDGARPELEDAYIAPRTPVEEILAQVWCDVLRVSRVGVHDNFFELGGHSLLATQVVSRTRQLLQAELPLRSLFESPTVAALASIVEHARLADQGMLEYPLEPVTRRAQMPLSYAQQRLWLIDKLESGTAAYNLPAAMRLTGHLDARALERSLSEIMRRHEVLRTTFHTIEGQPVQVISAPRPLDVAVLELGHLEPGERALEAQRQVAEEAARPFDLEAGPLFRASLLKLGMEEHLLLLTMHHIVSDGWSIGLLTRELSALYGAYSAGLESPLAELPIQYADYAVWQREWLQGERLERQLGYWKQQLGGAPAVLELPADHPRPAVQSFRGALHSFTLSPEVSEGIKALSQRSGVTLFMTLLAAFQLLLSRYSRQTDIVVGTPIAGRTRNETESLIGFFVNTLVLRTDCGGDPTFNELLGRVREVCLGAYGHQDVPFEKLVEELEPERDLSHNPLFQVMFALQNVPRGALQLSGLELGAVNAENGTEQFDLTLGMMDRAGGISGVLSYNREMFAGETMERMGRHLGQMLAGVVAEPERCVSEIEILSEEERGRMLVEWNETRREYPIDKCIHELFEEQAERAPDAVAVVFAEEALSYRELNRRANRLARALIERGVEAGVLVGLLGERSADFLTAMLAIFKAGGAYLPLDPQYPAHRLLQILEQSRIPLVIASSECAASAGQVLESMSGGQRPRSLILEELLEQEQSEGNLHAYSEPHNLAYVIYTSGSTGAPKGATVEHRGMLNHLFAKVWELELSPADVVAQTASQCFDISVWQFLAALPAGGQTRIFDDETAHDPALLMERIEKNGCTILETVPSMLRAMLDADASGKATGHAFKMLRWVVTTGEALPPELCQRWLSRFPHIPLLNAYGPTECSDDVTHYPIFRTAEADVSNIPIGRPIANTQIYILDARLQPVPLGVAGELCVGGIGVGRGYLNDAVRTAEVFIPNHFSREPGARLYKTGDLARYLANGAMEFLGRIDHQVKLRGFRIELGEIEAVLDQHPTVSETVVLVREDAPGDQRLVAYLVAAHEQSPTTSELRVYLKERLPEYMVPAAFVVLPELPLTPNGKLNRRALPAPDGLCPELDSSFADPRTPVEEVLAEVWAEVLELDRVSVNDNFFDLGGHSLLAMMVISRVRETLQVEPPLRTVFEAPSVAEFAAAILLDPDVRSSVERRAQLVVQLSHLSEDEVETMLDEKTLTAGGTK